MVDRVGALAEREAADLGPHVGLSRLAAAPATRSRRNGDSL